MDTRLTALLPAALGIKNGDVKMIKNAGGIISHPFGSVIRSLMVAIYELGVTEVMVIAHSDCGACHMSSAQMIEHMKARGIKQETIDMIRFCGVDFESWLYGLEDTLEDDYSGTDHTDRNTGDRNSVSKPDSDYGEGFRECSPRKYRRRLR